MKKLMFYIGLFILFGASGWLMKENYPYFAEYYQSVLDKIRTPDVKIFVTYHKPYHLPVKGNIVQPMQVGRAIEKEPFSGGQLTDENIAWLHENTIGDDVGDNISAKNRTFDVLTAYYWVWKHYQEIGNPKYIGFLAHRKMFILFENAFRKFNRYAPGYGYTEQGLKDLLEKHKIITCQWNPRNTDGVDIYDSYKMHHHVEDLDAMVALIKRYYPEMTEAMQDVLHNDYQDHAIWNFWIMDRELAFDYFEKLFPVMFEIEKERGAEIAKYDLEQRRAFGYLAERFFAIWVEYQIRSKKADPLFVPVQYL